LGSIQLFHILLVFDDHLQLEDQTPGQLEHGSGIVALGHFWKSTDYVKYHLGN